MTSGTTGSASSSGGGESFYKQLDPKNGHPLAVDNRLYMFDESVLPFRDRSYLKSLASEDCGLCRGRGITGGTYYVRGADGSPRETVQQPCAERKGRSRNEKCAQCGEKSKRCRCGDKIRRDAELYVEVCRCVRANTEKRKAALERAKKAHAERVAG